MLMTRKAYILVASLPIGVLLCPAWENPQQQVEGKKRQSQKKGLRKNVSLPQGEPPA